MLGLPIEPDLPSFSLNTKRKGLIMTKQHNRQPDRQKARNTYMPLTEAQHSLGLRLNGLAFSIAVAAITAGVTNAFGGSPTLTVIPVVDANDPVNEGRAITPDGLFVVGRSGSPDVNGMNWGFFYNATTLTTVAPLASTAPPDICTGVGYRTSGSVVQVIVDGWNGIGHMNWETSDGGLTWGAKCRNTSFTEGSYLLPAANSLGSSLSSDEFHTIFRSLNKINVYTTDGAGAWPATVGYASTGFYDHTAGMNGVAVGGRAVGYFKHDWTGGDQLIHNAVVEWPINDRHTNEFIGLDGTTKGQAFSVSADGTIIFGQSPLSTATGSTNYGYRVVVAGSAPSLTASSIHQLPNFPDTAGSVSLAVPYGCTPDGKYAVGMSYRGIETAVLWDTSNNDSTKWTVLDLMQYAANWGIAGGFNRLTRAYSAGVTAAGDIAITGYGSWSPDGGITTPVTRAFLMTVPKPIRTRLTFSGSYPAGLTVSYLNLGNTASVLEYATDLNLPHTWLPINTNQSGNIVTVLDASPLNKQRYYPAPIHEGPDRLLVSASTWL